MDRGGHADKHAACGAGTGDGGEAKKCGAHVYGERRIFKSSRLKFALDSTLFDRDEFLPRSGHKEPWN